MVSFDLLVCNVDISLETYGVGDHHGQDYDDRVSNWQSLHPKLQRESLRGFSA
jgi:hypothetical protein